MGKTESGKLKAENLGKSGKWKVEMENRGYNGQKLKMESGKLKYRVGRAEDGNKSIAATPPIVISAFNFSSAFNFQLSDFNFSQSFQLSPLSFQLFFTKGKAA